MWMEELKSRAWFKRKLYLNWSGINLCLIKGFINCIVFFICPNCLFLGNKITNIQIIKTIFLLIGNQKMFVSYFHTYYLFHHSKNVIQKSAKKGYWVTFTRTIYLSCIFAIHLHMAKWINEFMTVECFEIVWKRWW